MSCDQCQESLEAFVDGAPCDLQPVQTHLASCADCRDKEQRLRALARLLPAEAELSTDFDRRFFAKLAAEQSSRWRRFFGARFLEPLFITSCAALVAVFAVTSPSRVSPEEAFIAQNQDLLAHLDLALALDSMPASAEDFDVIRALPNLPRAN